jgi:hypothetical protein
MKNLAIGFVASSALATVIACGSSSGGSSSTGASSGRAGDAAAAEMEATDARPTDSAASADGTGDHAALDAHTGEAEAEADDNDDESSDGAVVVGGVCKSAADCADSGARAICCLGSSFESICSVGGCPLTSFGSYQLCASAAECAYPGQTYCGPFMGAVAGLVVCSTPPPDAGTLGDGG